MVVLHGKGDRRRTVGMDPAAFALLERWMDKRRQLALPVRGPVFCTLEGQPMDASYVRRLLPRLAARAGIDKRVHPHGLRHTHGFELAAEGVPVHVIHNSSATAPSPPPAATYAHVAPTERVAAMQTRQWTP